MTPKIERLAKKSLFPSYRLELQAYIDHKYYRIMAVYVASNIPYF